MALGLSGFALLALLTLLALTKTVDDLHDGFGASWVDVLARDAIFEGGARDDGTIAMREQVRGVLTVEAAADKHGAVDGAADQLEVVNQNGGAGSSPRDNQGVGSTPCSQILGGDLQVPFGEGAGVLDVDIGENLNGRLARGSSPQSLTLSEQGVSFARDHALVCCGDPVEDVDADEVGADHFGEGEGREGVVAQDVDSEGEIDGVANLMADDGHGGDGLWGDAVGVEGGISEVLNDESGVACAAIDLGRLDRSLNSAIEVGLPVLGPGGAAGERGEMEDGKNGLRVEVCEKHSRQSLRVEAEFEGLEPG